MKPQEKIKNGTRLIDKESGEKWQVYKVNETMDDVGIKSEYGAHCVVNLNPDDPENERHEYEKI